MPPVAALLSDAETHALQRLGALRQFAGPPHEFWPAYLAGAVHLCAARHGVVVTRPGPSGAWQVLQAVTAAGVPPGSAPAAPDTGLLDATVRQGLVVVPDVTPEGTLAGSRVALSLEIAPGQQQVLLLLSAAGAHGEHLEPREVVVRAHMIADVPAHYQSGREHRQAREDVVRLAEVLDLAGRIRADKSFAAASLTLCQGVAARFHCAQVSLGWMGADGYVHMIAISHMTAFDARMAVVQSLETAMEEALDQDCEILWPPAPGRHEITHAHEACARARGVPHLTTLPLRVDGRKVGALCCERADAAFSELDLWTLRLGVDHTVHWLHVLHRASRPLHRRLQDALTAALARLLSPGHVLAKAAVVAGLASLAGSVLIDWPYRVEAPLLLKTRDVFVVAAPFDGFIEAVTVREGDLVRRDQDLIALDTRELMLDKAAALTEVSRYALEAAKARKDYQLAEMKIAEARRAEAGIQLARVTRRLETARIRAPIDGIIVEGNLQEMLGAPVRKGDTLLKVASIHNLYVEANVHERDIHDVAVGQRGEMVTVGQPDQRFALRVEAITPAAAVHEGQNTFVVRAVMTDAPAEWWRPGMSGIARFAAGDRPVLWILTHRTIEFLRLFLWW